MSAWLRRMSPRAALGAAWLWLQSAFAGVVLIPAGFWIAGAVASAVIAGVAAAVGYARHDAWDAGGDGGSHRAGEIELTPLRKPGAVLPGGLQPVDPDRGLDQPLQPGSQRPQGDGSKPKPRPLGDVELRFHGNVDMRQLRYSLVYHPANPDDPDEVAYLHHVRRNRGHLSFVTAQEIESHPLRFPWHHTGPRRLCARATPLSAAEPTCEGVLRIPPQRVSKRGATTTVRAVLTAIPPQGGPGEEDLVEGLPTTIAATRTLELREVFFVTLQTLSRTGEVVYMVERDQTDPRKLRATRIDSATGYLTATLPHQADTVELSRDGSRLYLATLTELYEWRGEARMPAPIVDLAPTRRGWIAGMAAIDDAVCLAFASGQDAGVLRCRRQDTGTWNQATPMQSTPRRYGVDGDYRYSVASLGNSLVLVPESFDQAGRVRVVYVPDASLPIPRSQEVVLSTRSSISPGRTVNGVLPLMREPGQDLYLLYGSFPESRGAYAVLSVHELPGPDVAYLSLGRPFGRVAPLEQLRGGADAWVGPGQTTLRVFANIGGLNSTYYSLQRRAALAVRDVYEPLTSRPSGAVRLIEREQGARLMLVGGLLTLAETMSTALMVYRIDDYTAEPEFEAALLFPFSRPVRDLLRSSYSVQHITSDAVLLSPLPR